MKKSKWYYYFVSYSYKNGKSHWGFGNTHIAIENSYFNLKEITAYLNNKNGFNGLVILNYTPATKQEYEANL